MENSFHRLIELSVSWKKMFSPAPLESGHGWGKKERQIIAPPLKDARNICMCTAIFMLTYLRKIHFPTSVTKLSVSHLE